MPVTRFEVPATRSGVLVTNLGEPATRLVTLVTSQGPPQIAGEQSGKSNIFVGNAASAPGDLGSMLSFNDF